jgi:hypothetical protein
VEPRTYEIFMSSGNRLPVSQRGYAREDEALRAFENICRTKRHERVCLLQNTEPGRFKVMRTLGFTFREE